MARRQSTATSVAVEPPATTRRPVRRWSTAALLLVAAILVAAYVANAIAVNSIVASIASLQKERDAVRADNERQRAELLRLTSVERITELAEHRLGLVQPTMPPIALSTVRPNANTENGNASHAQR
jgi:cell division protein FtsB